VLLLVILVSLFPIGFLTAGLRQHLLDGGTPMRLPAWLIRIKEQDDVAFPAHALLGAVFRVAGCNAAASGLQWLKAAAHARNPGEVEQSVAGLRSAAQCLGSVAALAERLCPLVHGGYANVRQRRAVDGAGLGCSSR
jgi:hypothetical protein